MARSRRQQDQKQDRQQTFANDQERNTMNDSSAISHDDPRLTALSLGEADSLSESDLRQLSVALAEHAELRAEMDAIRQLSTRLRAELLDEVVPELTAERLRILREAEGRPRKVGAFLGRSTDRIRHTLRSQSPASRLRWAAATVALFWVLVLPVGGWMVDKVRYHPMVWVIRYRIVEAKADAGHSSAAREVLPDPPPVTPLGQRVLGQLGLASDPVDTLSPPALRDRPGAYSGNEDLQGEVAEGASAADGAAVLHHSRAALEVPAVALTPPAQPPRSGGVGEGSIDNPSLPAPRDPRRRIIKDAALGLEVARLDSALSQVEGIAAQVGGDILDSKRLEGQGPRRSFVRLAVPVDQFELVLGRLRAIATVVLSDQSTSADVSQEYVDLQSQLASLEATQARIKAFLSQAKTVEEALQVNARLQEVEGQMNTIKGRLLYIAEKAAYSTIAIDLVEQMGTPTVTPAPSITPTPTVTPSPSPMAAYDPAQPAREAYSVLRVLLRRLASLSIWLSVVGLPMAALAAAAWWLASRGLRWARRL